MKKLLLIAAVLAGAVTASQAGVDVRIGIGIPAPPPIVISRAPAYYHPPVVVAPSLPPRPWTPVVVVPPAHHHHHHHGYAPAHRPGYRVKANYSNNGRHERYTYRERWH